MKQAMETNMMKPALLFLTQVLRHIIISLIPCYEDLKDELLEGDLLPAYMLQAISSSC
jgi:hypothetical protein